MNSAAAPLDPLDGDLSDREYWHRSAAVAMSRCLEMGEVIRWCALEPTVKGRPYGYPILLTPVQVFVLLPDDDEYTADDPDDFTGALGAIESPADAHVMTDGTVLRPEHSDIMFIESVPTTTAEGDGCGWTPDEISRLLEDYWYSRLGAVTFEYDEEHARILRADLAKRVGGLAAIDPERHFTRRPDVD
jgi:hypothetical protein